ncbi:MAG: diacylglycerol/lipid kinase family protein [Acidobacteriota bacterium]
MARAMLLYNPAARAAPDPSLRSHIAAEFALRGFSVEEMASRAAGDLTLCAAEAVREGFQRVVICGGDGSVREAAQGLAGSGVELAVIPLGTANVLAREMRLPLHRLVDCAGIAASGTAREVGLGVVGEKHIFTFCASAGLDSLAVASVDLAMKRQTGAWAYVYGALLHLVSGGLPDLQVEMDDGRRGEACQLFILHAKRYGAGFLSVSRSSGLTVPTFRVVGLEPPLQRHLPALLPRLLHGGLDRGRGVWAFNAAALRIASDSPVPIEADGDDLARTPVEVTLRPRALTLVFPSDATSEIG